MEINLKNIEQIIFMNKQVRALLPEFRYIFDQWEMSHRIPGLRAMGQKAMLDLLNALKPEHNVKISEILNDEIEVNKLNNKIVEHYDCNVEDYGELCRFADYKDFCLYRKGNNVKITFWR